MSGEAAKNEGGSPRDEHNFTSLASGGSEKRSTSAGGLALYLLRLIK